MTDTTTPPTPYLPDAETKELEDWGALEEATGPAMSTAGFTLWSGEGDQEIGIWECTPGPSRWLLETNEFITLVAGRMTCTVDGGEPIEVATGDTAVFPKGWSGTWDIAETVRKVYVIF
jgi:uncharacterized cupin superfamily protein